MTNIRATCETCGDIELTRADVRVRVCINDNRGEYSFRCPDCGFTVVKAAEPRTIDLLVAEGVHMDTWSLPAEMGEVKCSLRPIRHVDLLDAHEKLFDEFGGDVWAMFDAYESEAQQDERSRDDDVG